MWSGVDKISGVQMALKRVRIPMNDHTEIDKTIEKMMREITLMRRLSHPNVVGYMGCEQDEEKLELLIFMELVEGGSVDKLLQDNGRVALPELRIQEFMRQLLAGLFYLHSQNIIHRDIKSANLLLTNEDVIKLCDFGAAKEATQLFTQSNAAESTGIAGTPNWMAPEVIEQSAHGKAADVWSVGCVLIELATGRPPFHDCSTVWTVMYQVAQGTLPEPPADMTTPGRQFLDRCLQRKPEMRATSEQLQKHPFLVQDLRATA